MVATDPLFYASLSDVLGHYDRVFGVLKVVTCQPRAVELLDLRL